MPHRSIVRIPKNKNISKARNACLILVVYFIFLLIFEKYWIIFNVSVCGLIITGAVSVYCLKSTDKDDSDDDLTSSDIESESDESEDIIYQAEVVLEYPPHEFEITPEYQPSAPPIRQSQAI